ncbi:MAG: ABC transporter substrate-binding protein, partial [Anaerolineae bacterium]
MRIRLLVGLLILAIGTGACVSATPTAEEATAPAAEEAAPPVSAESIKVGFFGPLTGPTSQAGRALMQGAQLKFEEVNEAGGVLGRQVEFITCDDKSTPEEAVKCVQRLINQDRVVVNVGSLHSPHLMATGPILDEFKVPTVAAGTSPTWCQQGFQYLWRALPNAGQATKALAAALEGTGLNKMAILYQNDDYGISGAEAIKESLTFAETVSEEAYNLGDKDWSGQIIKMVAAEPDFLVAWGLGDDLGPIFNQMRGLGWTGPIVAAEGATLPQIVDVAGENVDGVIFGALYYIPEKAEDMPNPLIREFLKKYEARYGE